MACGTEWGMETVANVFYLLDLVGYFSDAVKYPGAVKNRDYKYNILSRDNLHRAIVSNDLASGIVQFQNKQQGVVRSRKELLHILLHHDIVNDIPSPCARYLL